MTPYRVVYAPEAGDQLEALLLDIAQRASWTTAQRYVDAVVDTCERLAMFPLRGVARDDIRPDLRLSHHKVRTVIAYAVDEITCTVSIIGVYYGGQDHETLLGPDGHDL